MRNEAVIDIHRTSGSAITLNCKMGNGCSIGHDFV
jgi:hypothetical protein